MDADAATTEFVRWGMSHIVVLVLTSLAAFAVLWGGSRLSPQGKLKVCRVLAIVVATDFTAEYAWRLLSGTYGPWQENLPLHFCSVMAVLSVIALLGRKNWACATVYFGVLTASIQGLITPALSAAFPSPAFFIFFLSHSLLFISALAVPILIGWRGCPKDILRSMLIMDAYLLCIIPVNTCLGTNYGFTQASPVPGCLLDYLGPAPWYYVWLQLPALLVFRLMLVPVGACTKK